MKRFLLLPILLLTCAAWGAVDPSTGASSFSPNWTDLASVNSGYVFLQQSNGTVVPSVSGQQGMGIYSGTALSNDQYSQMQFVTHVAGSVSSTGPCVRMSATGNGVCYLADVGELYLLAGGGGIGDINSSCPIPASGDVIQLSVVGSTYTCSDLTTGASSSTQNWMYSSGQPAFIVDQRPSTAYAAAQVQVDCVPSCSGQPVSPGTPTSNPSTPNTTPSTPSTPPTTTPTTGTGWTDLSSVNSGYVSLQQANGTIVPSVAGQQGMEIYSGSLSNDQYLQLQFVAHGNGGSTGPCVRMSSTGDGVCYLADYGVLYLLAGGGGLGNINSSCPIPASGDVIQISVVGGTYTCSDLTTGASSSTQNWMYSSGQPAFIVDQRPSTAYAVAQVQADCVPSCGQPVSPTNSTGPSTPPTTPSTPPTTPPSTPPTDPSTPPTTPSTPPTTTPTPPSGSGQTWYVNGGGGTRYSASYPSGQCNGMSPNPYPGSGVNQNCAFKDIRSLWTDGTYTIDPHAGAPAWGWIGSSGDTYLIDCTGGALCRIGQNGPNVGDWYIGGIAGDPYSSGMPAPINGTPGAHTRILGANYQSCASPAARAHINGGYGVDTVLTLEGSSYVDVACFDITDFSNCGKSGQLNTCHVPFPVDDYATNGIRTNTGTNNTTITDVTIHGMSNAGIYGPTGDNVTLIRVALLGNPSSGWNMDDGSGQTGFGHLNLNYVTVAWSGCSEEYPIVDAQPYFDCTDDGANGYGDGIGTATVTSPSPWIISVDHSTAAYNTQDGFDFLHVQGAGSSVSITNTLAYGNMGQQIKLGAVGSAINNLLVGNCNALRNAIPGTPSGYNARLSDFCRAADTMAVVAVGDGATTRFINNTVYSANAVALEVTTDGPCTSNCFMVYDNNIFLGFLNNSANGYPSGGNGRYPSPIYFDDHPVLQLSGSSFSNNVTWNPKDTWSCPQTPWNEQNAICADPGLVDESYHLYGYGNMSPAAPSSIVVGKGLTLSGITSDILNGTRSTSNPTIGAYETTTNSLSLP